MKVRTRSRSRGRRDKLGENHTFFADWTVRHPDNENGELLQHCGPWPISVAREKPTIGYPLAFDYPGAVAAEAKHGEVTIARFDGDHGKYSMFIGEAVTTEGPYNRGTYVWSKVNDWTKWERKLVEGPFVHHVSGCYGHYGEIIAEACKYIPNVEVCFAENGDEIMKRWG